MSLGIFSFYFSYGNAFVGRQSWKVNVYKGYIDTYIVCTQT